MLKFYTGAKPTIYQKITALIVGTGLFFFCLFFSIYYYTIEQEEEVYEATRKQFDKEVTSLFELNSKTNVSNIVDIVYWDQFVDYLRTRSRLWFTENITSSVETYEADYLGIYDVSGKFISKEATAKIRSVDIIPKDFIELVRKKRVAKCYLKIPEGVIEVYGASVHSTADIYEKVTRPSGFFFIVKLMDNAYFDKLEMVNNSQIGFLSQTLPDAETHVFVTRNLKDANGQVVAGLQFVRPFSASFDITRNLLAIIIGTYFVVLLISLYYARRWVYKPLSLITEILEKENAADVDLLKKLPGEFNRIATLLAEKSQHNKMLETAKAKAEESDRLKSSFLANISHEIRTPMNAIIGFSDLLQQPGLSTEEQKEFVQTIVKSGRNLLSIIDDLIEMSEIDSNQAAPNLSAVNIEECIGDIYTSVRIGIPAEKQIDFQIKNSGEMLRSPVLTDKTKLTQILTNLVTNAVKFTEKGFVHFGYRVDAENALIEFKVADSGIGIDISHHSRIFDRFHRIENDIAIKAGGLGLGLAISKAYVDMLGGTITFCSGPENGTVFTFSIPLQYAEKGNDAVSARPAPCKGESLVVLVAEDVNINYLLIEKILTNFGHIVIRATNGLEAVEIAGRSRIDIVLMDVKMPVLDGYGALSQIKALKPDLPVIAQTAHVAEEDKRRIREAGFDDYLSKPINSDKLLALINRFKKMP